MSAAAPTAPARTTAGCTRRGAFRFSPDGRSAACLATDATGRCTVEPWTLDAAGPRPRTGHGHPGDATWSVALPLGGDRLLLSRHHGQSQLLHLLVPGEDGPADTVVRDGPPLRLLAAPEGSGYLAMAVSSGPDGTSTVHGIRGDLRPQEVARIPGRLGAGAVCGPRLVFTRALSGRTVPVAVHPGDGTAGELTLPGVAGDARVLAAGGGRVLLAVATTAGHRLALADTGGSPRVQVLGDAALDAVRGTVHPVALDPSGTVAALIDTRGAASGLVLHDWRTGTARAAHLPPGVLLPSAAWGPAGLWLPLATPRRPAAPCWLPPGGDTVRPAGPMGDAGGAHDARLERLPGAAGPIETVVYGPDWRTARRVVVALHGGPNSRWTLAHDPFLQHLAGAGLAVVAPNQRGSTGYGARHTLAITGDWGGPDLADVTALGAHIRAGRAPDLPPPALCGSSYGAYLALLVAALDGGPWSGCAAMAPFLSGTRLHADGGAGVRDMVERLGGRWAGDGSPDPRDLELLAPRLRLPLLLVHGARDETVPVAHSRILAARLAATRPHGPATARYLEVPGRGHDPLGASATDPVTAQVVRFLAAPDEGP
jgi:alpha-beta hydrolase superfamily lysophospholipase